MRFKSPSGLRCPHCKGSITDVHIISKFENSWEYSQTQKRWLPYAMCPDQGDILFSCEGCDKLIRVSSHDPDDWNQEMLNDMN